MSRNGWVPMPAGVWPLVRPSPNPGGRKTDAGPWIDEVAEFDLRWEFDQTGRVSSRGVLAERWGWTRDEVRTLLRHPERWWDPKKGPLPESREALTQRDPARPTLTQPDPPETEETKESETPDPARPTLTQPDPVVPHARLLSPSPSPSPPQEEKKNTAPPAPLVLLPLGPPAARPTDPTTLDPTPTWARGHKGVPSIVVFGAVLRALEAIRQGPVNPEKCATDAKVVLDLWKAADRPPIEALADDLLRVAQWARESDEAENDIRGVRADGVRWNKDRSHDVETLCRHGRFGDRVAAADRLLPSESTGPRPALVSAPSVPPMGPMKARTPPSRPGAK